MPGTFLFGPENHGNKGSILWMNEKSCTTKRMVKTPTNNGINHLLAGAAFQKGILVGGIPTPLKNMSSSMGLG